MVSTLFLRRRPRIAALLLVAGLYALVAVTAGASRLGLSLSSKGGAAPNLNIVTHTLDPCNPGWSVVSSPNAATYDNLLNGVASVSAGDVWAVGKDSNLGAPDSTLVEHWDGSAWTIVPSPNVGTDGSLLNGAVAISTGDVWAVGQYSNGTVYQTLVEHWNGSAWSVVPSPNLGSHENNLNGLAAISSNDVWAVGYGGGGVDTVYQTLVEHWDGNSWTIVPSPNAGTLADRLDGVAAVSAGDVWAVGDFEDTSIARHRTLTEHWDGSAWTIVPSPNISNNHDYLYSVAAMSTNDVWAAGLSMPEPFMNQFTLVEHWDGSAWTIVPSPNVPGAPNAFYGLAGVGPDDIWAIGYDTPNNVDRTLTEHWDGSAWTIVPSPNVGTSYNYLYGLAAVPPSGSGPGDMWAVGQYDDPGNGRRTLIENFGSCSGSPTPAATSTAAPTSTPTRTFTSVPTLTNTSVPAATGTSIPTLTSTPTLTVASTPVPSLTSTSEPAQPTLTSTSTSTSAPALTSTSVATATSTSAPSSTATPCPNRFSDVHAGDYFYEPVIYLACHDVISGYPDGTFRPFNNATRGQMAKIIVLAFGIPIDTSGGPHFSDVPVTNPFYPYVETAYRMGIASGYGDSTFRPFNNVTRGQLSKIVVTAAVQAKGWALINPPDPTFRDVPFGSTFYRYIETAVSKGVVSGYPDDTFRPGRDATRGQISKIVFYAVTQP